tara:strand:- start:5064 stop:6197 length:1134 start_codon:yes stop_codon:yes gene_type:complete
MQMSQSQGQDQSISSGEGSENKEPTLVKKVTSTAVKLALLQSMGDMSALFERKGTQNVLLPYLISFMNDSDIEVRAAFCRHIPVLGKLLGPVATEGIILPCFEQAILDSEERVSEAAVQGLADIVTDHVLPPKAYPSILRHVPPLLLFPARQVRTNALRLLRAICDQLPIEKQLVSVFPMLKPCLAFEIVSVDELPAALLAPLSRQTFMLLKENVEVRDAVLSSEGSIDANLLPLKLAPSFDNPMSGAEGDEIVKVETNVRAITQKRAEEQRGDDLAALVVLRQFLRSLLGRAKDRNAKPPKDMSNSSAEVLVPLDLHRVQAPKGNPFVKANQPLQVRAELRRLMPQNQGVEEDSTQREDVPLKNMIIAARGIYFIS